MLKLLLSMKRLAQWGSPLIDCVLVFCEEKINTKSVISTIESYSLIVEYSFGSLESKMSVTGLKSRCWQGLAPFRSSREECVPYLIQPLLMAPSFLSSRPASSSLSVLHLHITFFSVYIKATLL